MAVKAETSGFLTEAKEARKANFQQALANCMTTITNDATKVAKLVERGKGLGNYTPCLANNIGVSEGISGELAQSVRRVSKAPAAGPLGH